MNYGARPPRKSTAMRTNRARSRHCRLLPLSSGSPRVLRARCHLEPSEIDAEIELIRPGCSSGSSARSPGVTLPALSRDWRWTLLAARLVGPVALRKWLAPQKLTHWRKTSGWAFDASGLSARAVKC